MNTTRRGFLAGLAIAPLVILPTLALPPVEEDRLQRWQRLGVNESSAEDFKDKWLSLRARIADGEISEKNATVGVDCFAVSGWDHVLLVPNGACMAVVANDTLVAWRRIDANAPPYPYYDRMRLWKTGHPPKLSTQQSLQLFGPGRRAYADSAWSNPQSRFERYREALGMTGEAPTMTIDDVRAVGNQPPLLQL